MANLKPVPKAPVETPVVKKKSRWLLFAILGVVILGAAGGGAWYWLHQQHPAEPKAAEKKAPVFVTLEPFTVNLLQEGGDHYLQIGIVYQVEGDKSVEAMKSHMPILRSRILLLLSGKHPGEISQLDGKQKLVAELVLAARESLPDDATPERGIASAFLSAFVIQ